MGRSVMTSVSPHLLVYVHTFSLYFGLYNWGSCSGSLVMKLLSDRLTLLIYLGFQYI